MQPKNAMIPFKTKQLLKENWGPRAESMNCYAECKFFDDLSRWQCYIYAINPEDDDSIKCLLKFPGTAVEIVDWTLTQLANAYNSHGENPVMDREFRRIRVAELFKKLNQW